MIATAAMPSLASTLIPCFAGAGPMDAGTAAACCVWAIGDDDCGWGNGPTLLMSAPHLTQKRPLRGAPHLTQKLAIVNAPRVFLLEPAGTRCPQIVFSDVLFPLPLRQPHPVHREVYSLLKSSCARPSLDSRGLVSSVAA